MTAKESDLINNNNYPKLSSGYYNYGFDKTDVEKDCRKQSLKEVEQQETIFKSEKWYSILAQVSIPFFIAGIGTIGAGTVLATVTTYKVFADIRALYVLVPALLGLKGNLDMCLSSRLSTHANLGNMEDRKEIFRMVIGNIVLVQIQAIVCSCIVSLFATGVSAAVNGSFNWNHTLLLATASTLTATMSCFVLDIVLVTVIILSHKLKLNPDNLATPLAASIGDLVSLMVLSSWARILYKIHDTYPWLMLVILIGYISILLPVWISVVKKNKYTKDILTQGWVPVITALLISGCGGLILDIGVDKFRGYTIFQPIINGIGGNLVSVQVSRTSTMLHQTAVFGEIPPITKQWVLPWTALIKGVQPAKAARLLLLLSVPGHTIFVYGADFFYNGKSTITSIFVITYLLVGLIQLVILLYGCHLLVHTMWRYKKDPDNAAIPYLTAAGDLSGSGLLLLGFMFLKSINCEYRPVV
ncbi:solute carrier family 41 member 1-like isoform X2 [Diorhabda sublineata]|nr:solute carrier family 41 member 1-like isoform X2 [Diorhabda sublineata]XP_056649192.1 solute carrier family 41 member 1-like isoform X2 [Diorhabda sublineata]XP_056649193.1 solute carrier family 41 member 1-like isoform X2 [Diorhabda sublineata]